MVRRGVLAPYEALEAIRGGTLPLFGLMGIGGFLATEGFLGRSADALAARRGSAERSLSTLVWCAGIQSAVITNDAVCMLGGRSSWRG